ncbi:pepF/M3 family oligoendopeptidase [Streptohalobacillus salinus]|uniref:PepF/M3 family oligoendopeptidase n=1 Tax=Streptohalobacillus salinus TaxID=621096 RepID=A0A2V3W2K3_9BACI|nr:M3 family oligoendopeptidase [Streptohalobacillus salinus]PXW87348.1 pepF/M3 family oligoendopeptidase [Streptohalobacillus salinus]
MTTHYPDRWNLDEIFLGGTSSAALQEKIMATKEALDQFQQKLETTSTDVLTASKIKALIDEEATLEKALTQASVFVQMCHDANTSDPHATVVKGQVMTLYAQLQKQDNLVTKQLVALTEAEWDSLIKDPILKPIAFRLNERRQIGRRLLSDKEEALIADLNNDGLSGWSSVYDTIVSTMTIPFTGPDGETTALSVGQAMNRMHADADPNVRQQLFNNWEDAWTKQAPILTDVLNHLDGYRITLQARHAYNDHLEEPLEYNRMSAATLAAMWKAVDQAKQPFVDFLMKKAELLGKEQLGWEDVDAPLTLSKAKATTFSFDEACAFILKHFENFGPKLTGFTKHALEAGWVEAEDRDQKRPGGYCTSLPEDDQSRIFMTFTGSTSDTSTLAHELGHAFHSHVLTDQPYPNQQYAMNVAETASTFAEMIIADATVKAATSDQEKLMLLNTKLEGAVAMFMNIHARFLFEDQFYQARQKGVVAEETLNQMMEAAQKQAFGDALSHYHPHFWASKLHFFIDDVPFYNFPYTFGFLFSLGIYSKYAEQPDGFEDTYIALLKDTGAMTVEDLAKKHLDVDLTDVNFWANGIQLMVNDVKQFITLANQLKK